MDPNPHFILTPVPLHENYLKLLKPMCIQIFRFSASLLPKDKKCQQTRVTDSTLRGAPISSRLSQLSPTCWSAGLTGSRGSPAHHGEEEDEGGDESCPAKTQTVNVYFSTTFKTNTNNMKLLQTWQRKFESFLSSFFHNSIHDFNFLSEWENQRRRSRMCGLNMSECLYEIIYSTKTLLLCWVSVASGFRITVLRTYKVFS